MELVALAAAQCRQPFIHLLVRKLGCNGETFLREVPDSRQFEGQSSVFCRRRPYFGVELFDVIASG
jgi:hypothetical protein